MVTSTQVRSGLRSGVPGNHRSGPGLRSGGSRDLDLRPGPDRSISRPGFFLSHSPTDTPGLWMSERNEDDTKFVRAFGDDIPTKKRAEAASELSIRIDF